ncbi:MAG: hypothetical protein MZV65_29345 [Chromatiales bacterium]|nr:hypothetical protein [Chromatiales bacterium]
MIEARPGEEGRIEQRVDHHRPRAVVVAEREAVAVGGKPIGHRDRPAFAADILERQRPREAHGSAGAVDLKLAAPVHAHGPAAVDLHADVRGTGAGAQREQLLDVAAVRPQLQRDARVDLAEPDRLVGGDVAPPGARVVAEEVAHAGRGARLAARRRRSGADQALGQGCVRQRMGNRAVAHYQDLPGKERCVKPHRVIGLTFVGDEWNGQRGSRCRRLSGCGAGRTADAAEGNRQQRQTDPGQSANVMYSVVHDAPPVQKLISLRSMCDRARPGLRRRCVRMGGRPVVRPASGEPGASSLQGGRLRGQPRATGVVGRRRGTGVLRWRN